MRCAPIVINSEYPYFMSRPEAEFEEEEGNGKCFWSKKFNAATGRAGSCNVATFVRGVKCLGEKCETKQFFCCRGKANTCVPPTSGQTESPRPATCEGLNPIKLELKYGDKSTETLSQCASDQIMVGAKCSRTGCPSLTLNCSTVKNFGCFTYEYGYSGLTDWSPLVNQKVVCSANMVAVAIDCRGSNCASLSIRCANIELKTTLPDQYAIPKISLGNKGEGTCSWTSGVCPINTFVRGVKCTRSGCQASSFLCCSGSLNTCRST